MVRHTEYGSPFRNSNAGYDEGADKENQQRLKQGISNFFAGERKSGNYSRYDTSMYGNIRQQYGKYYGPALGYLFGKFYCDAFTSPKSRYVPKFIKIFCVVVGYRYGVNHAGRADFLFVAKNFALFPESVRNAYMHADARYLREYLPEIGKK